MITLIGLVGLRRRKKGVQNDEITELLNKNQLLQLFITADNLS